MILKQLCVTARNEAVQNDIFLDCFVVPPRNDAKRQKQSEEIFFRFFVARNEILSTFATRKTAG